MPKASDIKTQTGNGALFATPQNVNTASDTAAGTTSTANTTIIGDNLGDGLGVFAGVNQGARFTTMEFRSLEAGPGIRLTGDPDSIVIESTGILTTNLGDMNGILPVGKGGTGLSAIPFNAIPLGNGTNALATILPPADANQALVWNGTQYVWAPMAAQNNSTGTVKSVSVTSANNMITFSGSPIVETGTITATLMERNIPINNLNGVLGTSKGGTGLVNVTPNALLVGNGTNALTATPAPNAPGQVLTWMGTAYSWTSTDGAVQSISALGNNGISASATTANGAATLNISLTQTGVSSGTYANPTLSVDSFGRITSITATPTESIGGQNLGNVGQPIFAGKVGSNLTFKQIEADAGVSVTATQTSVKVGIDVVPVNKGGTGNASLTAGTITYMGSDRFYSIAAPSAGSTSILGYDGASYRWYGMPSTSVVSSTTDDVTVTSTVSGTSTLYTVKFNPENVSINEFGSILEVHKGGIGRSSLPVNSIILGNGANAMNYINTPTSAGTYLSWNGAGYEWRAVATSGGGISAITAGVGLTTTANSTAGGGVISTSGSLHIANTGVVAGTYKLLSANISATGQVTAATDVEEFVLDRSNHIGTMPADKLSGSVQPANGGTGLNIVGLAGKAGQLMAVNANETGYSFVPQSNYQLPMASANTMGGVKVGTTLEISSDGTLDVGRVDYSKLVNAPEQFSGYYNDLIGKPSLFSGDYEQLTNVPQFADVAISGEYADLVNKPVLAPVATTGSYTDLTNRPNISVVGTSGRYSDLIDAPSAPQPATSQTLGVVKIGSGLSVTSDGTISVTGGTNTGTPTVAGVTSVGLSTSTPAIVVSDNPVTSDGYLSIDLDVDLLGLAPVAFSSSYYDLNDAPDLSQYMVEQDVVDALNTALPPQAIADAARNAISVGGDLVYNADTGVISYTAPASSGFSGDYADLTNKPTLFSGSYNDLTDKPVIPAAFSGSYNDLTDKPTIPEAFSGSYNDLTDTPTIPNINGLATEVWVNSQIANASIVGGNSFSGNYEDLAGKPVLFSGSYTDLTNKPTIPSVVGLASETWVTQQINNAPFFSGDYADLTNKPTLFSGSYNDLTDKPAAVTPYTDAMARAAISVAGDLAYNTTTGVISYTTPAISYNDLTDKPVIPEAFSGSFGDLVDVPDLFSGSYNDLTDKPTIPSVVGLASEAWVTQQLSNVAPSFSGSYNDLTDKPAIPTEFTTTMARSAISVAGDLAYDSATGVISYTAPASSEFSGDYTDLTNKPTLFSGSYNDLTDKPTMPTQYTDAMARSAVSLNAGTSGVTYDAATGVLDTSALVSSVTTSVGDGTSLVSSGAVKSLVAGSGITLQDNGTTVTVNSTATGGSAAATPISKDGQVVVAAPTSINFTGDNVTVTDVDGVATISVSQEVGLDTAKVEYLLLSYNAGTGGGMTMTDAIKETSPGVVEASVVDPDTSKISFKIRGRSTPPSSIWVYGYNSNQLFWTCQPYSNAVGSLTMTTEGATAATDGFVSSVVDRTFTMNLPYASSGTVGKALTRPRCLLVFGY